MVTLETVAMPLISPLTPVLHTSIILTPVNPEWRHSVPAYRGLPGNGRESSVVCVCVCVAMLIERRAEHGGNVTFDSYQQLETAFADKV